MKSEDNTGQSSENAQPDQMDAPNTSNIPAPDIEIEAAGDLPEKTKLQQGYKSELATGNGPDGKPLPQTAEKKAEEKKMSEVKLSGLSPVVEKTVGFINKRLFEYDHDSEDTNNLNNAWNDYFTAKGWDKAKTSPELALLANHMFVEMKAGLAAFKNKIGIFRPKVKKPGAVSGTTGGLAAPVTVIPQDSTVRQQTEAILSALEKQGIQPVRPPVTPPSAEVPK